MPWTNQGGGGPWGSRGGSGGNGSGGGGGPWGTGGGGGGPGGPDLEEIIRRSQDRMRNMLPGGLGSTGVAVAIALVVVLWLFSGLYTVEPEEQGLELLFGEYKETTPPGLHYHFPFPIERVIKVPVTTVRRVEIGFRSGPNGNIRDVPDEGLMLTGDENIIDVNFVTLWAVKNAEQFAFNVRDPAQTVKDASESTMREVMGQTNIASALAEGRQQVAQEARSLLQSILDEYQTGIEVRELLLQRADPPPAVIDDYRDVQRARADMERLINEAQAYRNRVLPQASGEAARLRQEAQAYKEQVVSRAQGAAQRFISVYDQYAIASDVTRQRIYLETMERVLRDMNKIILQSGDGSPGVVPYLPLPEIRNRAGSGDRSKGGSSGNGGGAGGSQ